MFGEVVDRESGVTGGRAKEGVAPLLSGWLMRCVDVTEWVVDEVCNRMEGGVIQAYVA